jgi:hypothetical protein
MWGLDDLLDDVKTQDGEFGDVSDNVREAFSTGVKVIEEY